MDKKTGDIRARLPSGLRERLDAIHAKHLTNDSTVAVHTLLAFCDYVEATGKVEFPVKMIHAKESGNTRRAAS